MANYPTGVSVLICTYNGAQRLIPTLRYLAQQASSVNVPWEVILVDNNSTDDTAVSSLFHWTQLGAPAPLNVLKQAKAGKQFALELAYDAAQYEFMCIVDDDNWLHAGYLQNGYDCLHTNPNIGLLGGSNTGAFEIEQPAWFIKFQASYAVGEPPIHLIGAQAKLDTGEIMEGALWGAGLFVRHAIWDKLKILNFKSLFTGRQGEKQLTAGEDDELCYLARLLGYKIWYIKDLHCTHFMTAGRLNEDYLKRLCYASSKAYPAMSAYQRVLAADGIKYSNIMPWLKDWAYLFVWSVKGMLSKKYLKSIFSSDSLARVRVNQQVLSWVYFTKYFNTSRRYYQEVVMLRKRIQDTFNNQGPFS